MNKLDDEEIFKIFKRTVKENRSPNSYYKEYNLKSSYIYNRFKQLGLPTSLNQKQKVGQDLINKIVEQNTYTETKELIEQCREILREVANKEEMKQQALEIMEVLKLHENVINDFTTEDKLNKSETSNGFLYWLDDEEKQMVEVYEKRWNVLVYHVIKTYTVEMGAIYDLLYIPSEKESWQGILERLKQDNIILSHTISAFSESGDIAIKSKNGGVIRLY